MFWNDGPNDAFGYPINGLAESDACRCLCGQVFAQPIEGPLSGPLAPIPSCSAISFQDAPCARRAAILVASTTLRGRPRRFPLARAFRKPARTRSAIRLRSSSATAPRTVNTILAVGVLVSTCSERLTNSISKARNAQILRDGFAGILDRIAQDAGRGQAGGGAEEGRKES